MQRCSIRRRSVSRLWAGWILLASFGAVSTFATRSRAQSTGTARTVSPYELDTLAMSLKKAGLTLEPKPDGKRVEGVEVATVEVFDEREGLFQILNVFHATTLPIVLRREVLLEVGDAYDRELVDETARNLRTQAQTSLVMVVPIKGKKRNTVRLLILTKDVWSIRLNWDIKGGSGGLDVLQLEPTEINLAGTHQSVSVRYIYRPETFTLGASYREPRLQGTRVQLAADASVILNRESGQAEGSYGYSYVQRPLFSTRTEWSWLASNDWRDEHIRRYVDTKVATVDVLATRSKDALRDEYLGKRFTETLAVTRSFGVTYKTDFTLGGEVNRRAYRLPNEDYDRFPAEALNAYIRSRVPVTETRIGPALQTRFYTTKFKRLLDFETIGLQEDVRLGYNLGVKVYPVFHELGATRSFFGTDVNAEYTWEMGDGLVRLGGELINEFETEQISDASLRGTLRVATPRLGFGRFVLDAMAINRYRNSLNVTNSLGGDTRLRGYPTSFFVGKDVVTTNLEFRTSNVQIFTVLFGAAAFFDLGDAFTGFDKFKAYDSAGGGLRVLFPQFDRVVFRADLAFPITRPLPAGVSTVGFYFAFQQAFDFVSYANPPSPTIGQYTGLLNR